MEDVQLITINKENIMGILRLVTKGLATVDPIGVTQIIDTVVDVVDVTTSATNKVITTSVDVVLGTENPVSQTAGGILDTIFKIII